MSSRKVKSVRAKKGGDGDVNGSVGSPDVYGPVSKSASFNGGSSSKYIVFKLPANQSVVADSASLLYLKDGIQKGEMAFGSKNESAGQKMLGFFGRSLSGETAILQKYTGPGTVALGGALPGDVMMMKISPGQTHFLSQGAFIACTENVRISGGFNMLGVFAIGQEEGPVLPTATVIDSNPGYIWIGGYGAFEKHDLQSGESMLVNNGLFLACDKRYDSVETLGKSMMSSLFGEGLGMRFNGPCTLHTQSKDINDLVSYVSQRLPKQTGGGGEPKKVKRTTRKAASAKK
jgi:uncharacterized protein (AIM24 family)